MPFTVLRYALVNLRVPIGQYLHESCLWISVVAGLPLERLCLSPAIELRERYVKYDERHIFGWTYGK